MQTFLAEHTTHVAGVRTMTVGGRQEVMLDRETATAFADWCVRRGLTTPAKRDRLLTMLAGSVRRLGCAEG